MKEAIKRMNDYFEAQIQECGQQREALLRDERKDEANLQKIRANVYDIFKTVLEVGQKTGKDSPEQLKAFFLEKIQQIPSSWQASYDAAKQHGDAEKLLIEQIKLETAQTIRREFEACWEEVK